MIETDQASTLRGNDLSSFLRRWAQIHGNKAALHHTQNTRTYSELDGRASRVAAVLASFGVRPGDRVAVLSGNNIAVVEIIFGILRLGAIVVPLNIRLHRAEIEYQIADSGCGTIIGEHALLTEHAAGFGHRTVLALDDTPGPETTWIDLRAQMRITTTHPSIVVNADAPAFIIYTSGTTGRPKGAVLSHHGLVTRTYCGLVGMGVNSCDEVWYSGLPLFHVGGWCSVLMYLFVGGTVIIAPTTGFNAEKTLADMLGHDVTGGFFVPTQWDALCSAAERSDRRPPLRRLVWGASPASLSTLRHMAAAFPGVPNISAFGQTEMSSATCMLSGDESLRKMGSVGRPLPGVAARIVDEQMNDVPVGEVGEIVYQGPTVFLGYWNRPGDTAEAMAGGWFHSGDLCRRDDEGYIWVVDRKKDMIVSGGENIYCAELESVLSTHPDVADVAVIGIAHPTWVETPLAVVVPRDPDAPPTAAAVITHAAAHLASFKKPSEVWFVPQLPRNASGKVLKEQLRQSYAARQEQTVAP